MQRVDSAPSLSVPSARGGRAVVSVVAPRVVEIDMRTVEMIEIEIVIVSGTATDFDSALNGTGTETVRGSAKVTVTAVVIVIVMLRVGIQSNSHLCLDPYLCLYL